MMPENILSIIDTMATLDQNDRDLLERLFAIERFTGHLEIPASFAPKIARWYARPGEADSEPALARARTQTLIRTLNRWTYEGAVFNPLRALRPLPPDGVAALAERIERSRRACDFCDPLNLTTSDTWGRLRGRACLTAANAAKFDAHHGLVIFNEHNPLRFDSAAIADFLEVAERWFARTHAADPEAVFPFLSWNCLEKAAASQLHGHLQVILSSRLHQAGAERLRHAAQAYAPEFARYFADLIRAHECVGLQRRIGDCAVLAHLTPIKEREVVIIAPPTSTDLGAALAHVPRTFIDRLGVTCFNVGILYPPRIAAEGWAGFPIVARVVDRGPTGTGTVDIGGMELYGTPVVSADPYEVIRAISP
jgi:hypothetical protein